MSSLFGGSRSTTVNNSGFGALPPSIQQQFSNLAESASILPLRAEEYFRPQGFSAEELNAQNLINQGLDQNAITSGVNNFLNPYRDILFEDINREFDDARGTLASRASEAGAFGSSRYREDQSDLERERLNAIARASGGQFNNALNDFLTQRQQTIQNQLGFGSFGRNLDLQQRQALPTALQAQGNLLGVVPSSSQSSSSGRTSPNIFGTLFRG